jgi:GGDEF domain-containing protein
MDKAEILRTKLATARLLQNKSVTASFGVSIALQADDEPEKHLVQNAESALRLSASSGRNMVSTHTLAAPQ